jgi:hypothetical protein
MMQKNNHGLPRLQVTRPETQDRHFITLSEAQSTALMERVKQVVGSEANITHLGHAAMVLALLRSNPLTKPLSMSPQPLHSPCWLNGRRYLRSSTEHLDPTKDFVPLCISFAPIIFPDLEEISLSRSADGADIKSKLLKACKVATKQYEIIKNRKSMLPECIALFESFGEKMRYANPRKRCKWTFSAMVYYGHQQIQGLTIHRALQQNPLSTDSEQDTSSSKCEVETADPVRALFST